MSVLLLPAWILSGAMFPAPEGGWIHWIELLNPMSYAVSAVRRALYAGGLPSGTGVAGSSVGVELAVLVGFSALAAVWSIRMCYRRR
jgi:ABC-type multidrug transport system permease subunit